MSWYSPSVWKSALRRRGWGFDNDPNISLSSNPSPDVEALTDPSVEDPNVVFRGLDPSAQENLIRTEGPNGTLESPSQRRSRTRSLYVAMAILFFGAMMASVTVPSLYLFLESMKPGPTMTPSSGTDSHLELGIVSAMFPLGQLLGLPVTNYWYVRKNARQVFITMGIFSIIFSMGYLFALNRFAILLSRFSLGFCLSGTLITLPYIAHSTPVVGSGSSGSERFYFISISTTLLETGFALGPVFGVLMMNVSFYVGKILITPFRAPGLLSIVFSFVLVAIAIFLFDEYRPTQVLLVAGQALSLQSVPSRRPTLVGSGEEAADPSEGNLAQPLLADGDEPYSAAEATAPVNPPDGVAAGEVAGASASDANAPPRRPSLSEAEQEALDSFHRQQERRRLRRAIKRENVMQLFSMFRMRGVDRGALLITATLSGVGNLVCSALFTATPPFLTELYDWDLNAVSYFYAVLAILSSLTVFIFRLANIFPNYRIGMLLGLVIMAVGSIGANSFSKEITPIWRFLVFDLFFAIGYPLLQSFSMMMFIQISGPMYYSLLIPIILGATLFARALGHMLSVVFYDLNPLGDALLYACFFASIFAIALLLVFWPRLVPHRRPPDFDPYQEAVDLSSEAERLDARSTGRAAGSRHDGGTGGSSSGAGSGGGGARVADASDADSRRMSTMSLDSDVGRAWARHSTTTFGSMADPGSGSFTAAGLGNPRAGGRARGVSFLLQHDYSTLDEFGDVGDDFTTNPYTLRPEQQPQPQPQPLPQPQQQEATVAVATAAGDIPGGGASRPVPAARSASDASAATLFGTSLAPGAPAAGPRGSKPAAELSRRSADLLAEAASDQHMALSSWMIDYMSDNEWSDDPDGGRVPPGAGPGDLLQDAYFPGGL